MADLTYCGKTMEALLRLGIAPELVARRGLCEHPEAEGLVVAETARDGRKHLLVPAAAQAWNTMRTAAAAEGVTIYIISAFRSVQRQVELIERKLLAGEALERILTIVAPPGFSEHHSARAIDIGSPGAPVLDSQFDRTPAFLWLNANAGAFGFVLSYPEGNAAGYQYEPWHWCFHP